MKNYQKGELYLILQIITVLQIPYLILFIYLVPNFKEVDSINRQVGLDTDKSESQKMIKHIV